MTKENENKIIVCAYTISEVINMTKENENKIIVCAYTILLLLVGFAIGWHACKYLEACDCTDGKWCNVENLENMTMITIVRNTTFTCGSMDMKCVPLTSSEKCAKLCGNVESYLGYSGNCFCLAEHFPPERMWYSINMTYWEE